MNATDARHGKTAGYIAGCRKPCCRTVMADYERRRRARNYLYGPLIVDALGTRRRIQALMALGWSGPQLDEMVGRRRSYTVNLLLRCDSVHRSTAEAYAALYERLCMTVPPQWTKQEKRTVSLVRNRARANGWAPPLAWDDIDDPEERPKVGWKPREIRFDPVVVERFLSGDDLPTTRAEREAIVARWRGAGRSLHELEERTGWRTQRYYEAAS